MSQRVVLVGCGGISDGWLKAIDQMHDLELVALVDLDEQQARSKAESYNPNAVIKTDVTRAIEKSGADLVFDCTTPGAHATVDTQALEAGCDVLCEKPLASTLSDARRVIDTARRVGKTHAVMQNRRYNPSIRAYRKLIADGSIGTLATLNADFYLGAHFGGFRAEMEHVLLLDMAIHTFDAARFLSGGKPRRISCTEWNPEGSWFAHGASAVATVEMDNGVRFSYRGSWASEGCATSWESNCRAIGTKGTALWDGGEGITGEVVTGEDGFMRPTHPLDPPGRVELPFDGHAGCIRAFVDALDAGRQPETASKENYYSLAMSLGAIESADNNTTVTIEELS